MIQISDLFVFILLISVVNSHDFLKYVLEDQEYFSPCNPTTASLGFIPGKTIF